MVRNVKLGHGLFDLIKTEQAAKVRILKGFLILSASRYYNYSLALNHFIIINTLAGVI